MVDGRFGLPLPADLDRDAVRLRYQQGADIFVEGDAIGGLLGIVSGRVKLWRTLHDGTACALLVLGPGEILGSVAVAQGVPQLTSATTITAVELVSWNAHRFRDAIRADADLSTAFLKLLSRRAVQLLDRVEDVAQLPVEARLARAILRIVGEAGGHDDALAVTLNVRQQDLADLAVSTVPTISRILTVWRREGVIETARGRIVIPHLSRIAGLGGLHLD